MDKKTIFKCKKSIKKWLVQVLATLDWQTWMEIEKEVNKIHFSNDKIRNLKKTNR